MYRIILPICGYWGPLWPTLPLSIIIIYIIIIYSLKFVEEAENFAFQVKLLTYPRPVIANWGFLVCLSSSASLR